NRGTAGGAGLSPYSSCQASAVIVAPLMVLRDVDGGGSAAAGGERAAPVEELGNRSVSSVTERAGSGESREQDDPRHDKRPAGDNPKGYLLDTTGRYELGA